MLMDYILKSSMESPSSINLVAVDDEILSVSAIIIQTSILETFYVKGEILLPEHFQEFYVLGCLECNHLVRSKIKREVQCINCKLQQMLISRCHFEVEITYETGTTTVTVYKGLAERMLSIRTEQIYEIVSVKLADKLFRLQLQRSLSRTPTQMQVLWSFYHTVKNQPCFSEKSQHLWLVPRELWKKSQYM
nr:uncharacterized protein LOC117275967 [Nicotiana tomentosiformis]